LVALSYHQPTIDGFGNKMDDFAEGDDSSNIKERRSRGFAVAGGLGNGAVQVLRPLSSQIYE
jgi:hypothetical protein